MRVTILGIRHHGVGSAKNVLKRLQSLQPDMLLVEGPPETTEMLAHIGSAGLKPPASILCYDENEPQRAAFYPFSEFSPEWQAILYANQHKVPVRSMDLPIAFAWQLELEREAMQQKEAEKAKARTEQEEQAEPSDTTAEVPGIEIVEHLSGDPIGYFAKIAGYEDSDRWWETQFEQRVDAQSPEDYFESIMLMMRTLREQGVPSALDEQNVYREAYMGNMIREAQRELYQNIVVVCGAWHAPALLDLEKTEAEHAKIVKKLPKTKLKVGVAWIPWTFDRLSMKSGYGAGILSPGWYQHLWDHPRDNGAQWLAKVARLFRKKKMDTSTAHVIESLRLAESLAALRNLSRPGLFEHKEAIQTVMCMGDHVLLDLVNKELIIGHRLGQIPDKLPKLPLQGDFELQISKLRLSLTAETKNLVLDLRKELDLQRSIFFHQLILMEIKLAKPTNVRGKGTYKEAWDMAWNPEMMVSLIEKGIWGNTIEAAATQWMMHLAKQTTSIAALSKYIQLAIPAELFKAIEFLLVLIEDSASVSSDTKELMEAISPLADVGRYGNVRKTDLQAVHTLIDGMLTRICIGLPMSCSGLDEATAQKMFDLIRSVDEVVRLLESESQTELWFSTLIKISEQAGIPPLLAGCTNRLLFDGKQLTDESMEKRFSLALSSGNPPEYSAGWIEGFLKGSGMILLHDEALWNLLFSWVAELEEDNFIQLIPILRRTFSKYDVGERRSLGQKAKSGVQMPSTSGAFQADNDHDDDKGFDHALAAKPMAIVANLLGIFN